MERILKRISLAIIVAGCMLCFTSHAQAAGPWTGKVVDYDTGEPLEGVVILAVWKKSVFAIVDMVDRFHRAYETVTDENGYFEIPSYINITIPLISHGRGPYTTFFKPGYLLRRGSSEFLLSGATVEIVERTAIWPLGHYKYKLGANLVALPKLKTKEERKRQLARPTGVPDKYMPSMLKAISTERVNLGLTPLKYSR